MLDNCRLCGSDDLILWMRDGHNSDLDYYKCSNCTLWNYDLDCGVDQTQYTEIYVSPEDTEHHVNISIRESWDFIRRHTDEPGSIMDIGCGSAGLLYLARKDGWQVRGMELSEKASKEIFEDQGIDVIVANFLEYDNPDNNPYDVVVLRHVLEHLPDSILAMTKIGSLIKDNGLALLEFPNTRSLSYVVKRALKNRGLRNKKYSTEWRPGHCNEFCRESFEYLLKQTGFELVVWHTYSSKPLASALYRVIPIASKARALIRKKPTTV
ncbi:MAG: class I SAM-dependent methyltransferase [Gammaproteobacteria bacterium]|nr:class I SAM-dependent methyltransferase [Gammaproteobacteria bacterium]